MAEGSDDTVEISERTAEVAERELDLLIIETEDEDPDPLTDDVFQAREELREVLDHDG